MGPVCESEPEIGTHSSDPGNGFETSLISRHQPVRVSCHSDFGGRTFLARDGIAAVIAEIAANVMKMTRDAHFM